MEDVLGIKNPRVGLVNVGVEEAKGNQLVKETGPLLKECENINYIGSIEAREIPYGAADVVVCDAFAGNIVLKLEEGLSAVLVSQIKEGMDDIATGNTRPFSEAMADIRSRRSR